MKNVKLDCTQIEGFISFSLFLLWLWFQHETARSEPIFYKHAKLNVQEKSLQKEKANFIFYITLRDHYKFCKGRENRIMWLRKPKAFHSSACILEQSPFMYNDRFHRPDIIMSDIMREVLLISHCNHMFSQSLYQVYAFDYFNVQYIF